MWIYIITWREEGRGEKREERGRWIL